MPPVGLGVPCDRVAIGVSDIIIVVVAVALRFSLDGCCMWVCMNPISHIGIAKLLARGFEFFS